MHLAHMQWVGLCFIQKALCCSVNAEPPVQVPQITTTTYAKLHLFITSVEWANVRCGVYICDVRFAECRDAWSLAVRKYFIVLAWKKYFRFVWERNVGNGKYWWDYVMMNAMVYNLYGYLYNIFIVLLLFIALYKNIINHIEYILLFMTNDYII